MAKPDFAISEITHERSGNMFRGQMTQVRATDQDKFVGANNHGEDELKRIVETSSLDNKSHLLLPEVTSDGTTGLGWIKRLEDIKRPENKGFGLKKVFKEILLSSDFKPTNGVVYKPIAVLSEVFADKHRTMKNIHAYGKGENWLRLHPEVMCLLRENLKNDDLGAMGLDWLVGMHEPINDSSNFPSLLGMNRLVKPEAGCGRPECGWGSRGGFVFLLS